MEIINESVVIKSSRKKKLNGKVGRLVREVAETGGNIFVVFVCGAEYYFGKSEFKKVEM